VTQREFCDIKVCEKDIEDIRIKLNENTEKEVITKSKQFFVHVILQNIMGS
jgi:hypothetical protein